MGANQDSPTSTLERVCNSGGWSVDRLQPDPLHGASVVLVGDGLDVASLRFYNETADGHVTSPRLAAVEGEDGSRNSLYARLQGSIDFTSSPWSDFSQVVDAEVRERQASGSGSMATLKKSLGLGPT